MNFKFTAKHWTLPVETSDLLSSIQVIKSQGSAAKLFISYTRNCCGAEFSPSSAYTAHRMSQLASAAASFISSGWLRTKIWDLELHPTFSETSTWTRLVIPIWCYFIAGKTQYTSRSESTNIPWNSSWWTLPNFLILWIQNSAQLFWSTQGISGNSDSFLGRERWVVPLLQ